MEHDENINFQNFVKLQKEIESLPIDTKIEMDMLTFDELFHFFEEHYSEFHNEENLRATLVFAHRCLKAWYSREGNLSNKMGIILTNFLQNHEETETDLNVAVQIIFQIVISIKSFGNQEIKISQELLRKLIILLLATKSRNLISNIIVCIQLYINMFTESSAVLKLLWSDLLQDLERNLNLNIVKDTSIDILIQLFDEFKSLNINIHNDPILIATTQHLLKSNQRKYRKCGYYLTKKILHCMLEKIDSVETIDKKQHISGHKNQQTEHSWTTYITLLENLEEEQSHLILPSLANLEMLIKNKCFQSSWLDILNMRILKHNNNLVLRWSIEFFLSKFACFDLNTESLKYILNATNSNLLFNYEGYFVNLDYFSTFLNGDLSELYTLLPEIENWISLPFYIWLEQLQEKELPKTVGYELVLKVSACVRKLQNCTIRENAIRICNNLFKNIIQKMSMEEFVTYVETLYNLSDNFCEYEIFFGKKTTIVEANQTNIFKQRFYEIFTNFCWNNDNLLEFLNDITNEHHGWLKFAIFHKDLSQCNKIYISNMYNLDLNSLALCDLQEITKIFQSCLLGFPPYDKEELRECQRAAISFYIRQKKAIDSIDDDTLRYIFDSEINKNVSDNLAEVLYNTKKQLEPWIIDELIKNSVGNNCIQALQLYFLRAFPYAVHQYALKLLEKTHYSFYNSDILYVSKILEDVGDCFFNYSVSKGENRIEQAFCFHRFGTKFNKIKHVWLEQIRIHSDEKYVLYLLEYHSNITKKKPRYFENSHEHRIKLRIAVAILYTFLNFRVKIKHQILDKIWNIILKENNQLNVTYIYEYFLATYEEREDFILNNLQRAPSLQFSQQISVISVVYNFSVQRLLTYETKKKIISNLLALSMGEHFQTRLIAQMSLYKLLKSDKFDDIENSKELMEAVEKAAGTKLQDYLYDIRINISSFFQIYKPLVAIEIILYITNAPFDERLSTRLDFSLNSTSNHNILITTEIDIKQREAMEVCIIKCRKAFMKKVKIPTNDLEIFESISNDQIQRKMNPINDLTQPSDLIYYPIEENSSKMFVVTSLIDKLPNLGGIARTCEVLGIQNLVMSSKMDTIKTEFKSLSMTAEKSLNILEVKPKDLKEFLLNKKLEGFKIVGAEQTSKSQNFNNFEFPEKCILLLGHEKDGIPAPLLGLLDYAVEIPQFGQVRSLNVHVTGALFMWEYCKQHLMQRH